ncbi:hypothetical protein Pmar_PMAR023816 [Perkinsus marinus ATCC 50983]|uniref:Uncharacterized protein n=1 Tax=Perkinsus marinus (strain ATCC 50983 / TXsc) TaxID=423536 RepID=C5KYK7_PERM5|nr:hypothetical protein Pmar_PMAR023816 [Perkinsus marinus ATCC 50983]EER10442.1 hypothetical protein Pmar_PMAR023816 [Perkinsus marinus ATCC 50983]|eukprot:XP_002778647.1 hypothetical protein Pmar_PMAR023816 [Perkinsus marinus ATCC 50983]
MGRFRTLAVNDSGVLGIESLANTPIWMSRIVLTVRGMTNFLPAQWITTKLVGGNIGDCNRNKSKIAGEHRECRCKG